MLIALRGNGSIYYFQNHTWHNPIILDYIFSYWYAIEMAIIMIMHPVVYLLNESSRRSNWKAVLYRDCAWCWFIRYCFSWYRGDYLYYWRGPSWWKWALQRRGEDCNIWRVESSFWHPYCAPFFVWISISRNFLIFFVLNFQSFRHSVIYVYCSILLRMHKYLKYRSILIAIQFYSPERLSLILKSLTYHLTL